MKLNSLKKYIFGNILSLDGYIMLFYVIYFWFNVKLKHEAMTAEIIAKYGEDFFDGFYILEFDLVYICCLSIILFFLFIEFLVRKKWTHNIFKNTDNRIYSILFWIGIILLLIIFTIAILPQILLIINSFFI